MPQVFKLLWMIKKRIEIGKGEGVIFVVVKASGSFRLPNIMASWAKGGNKKRPRGEPWSFMGATGFEPVTPSVSSWCSSQLS
jgi:hypothetical protein